MQLAWKIAVLILVAGLLGWGVSNLFFKERALRQEGTELSRRLETVEQENASLAESIEYYQNPENLMKELKSQFNYREGGEKLMIIVPAGTSTKLGTSTSTQ